MNSRTGTPEEQRMTSPPWPGGPFSENMPGATLTMQIGPKAATTLNTGQRDFWSTGSSFTSAPEQLHEQDTSCHCLCSRGLSSPCPYSSSEVQQPQASSQLMPSNSSSSAALGKGRTSLVPFQDLSPLRAGWPMSSHTACQPQPATTENTFSICPCSFASAESSQPDSSKSCT